MRQLDIFLFILFCWFVETPPFTQSQTIEGKLLGADGKPMKKAHVVLEGPKKLLIQKKVEADGSFSVQFEGKGGYYLYLMGVHHQALSIPIVIDRLKSVELEVRLKTVNYVSQFDSVKVIGNFNHFSNKEGVVQMEQQPDNTFTALIKTQLDSISYHLLGFSKTEGGKPYPLCGTQADRYVSNLKRAPWASGSHFFSVMKVDGNATKITFDQRKLPHSKCKESVQLSDSTLNGIVSIYLDVESRERLAGLAYAAGKNYDWSVEQAVYHRLIKSENNPILRQLALLRYFDELQPREADSLLARQALREVPPDSPIWSLEARSPVGASNLIYTIGRIANKADSVIAYMERVIEEHFDPAVKVQFLYRAFRQMDQSRHEAKKRYYLRLATEFSDTPQFEEIRHVYSPDRAIQAGKSIPEFALVSLKNSATIHTRESLQGKIYLIDFWGTWCAPCVAEMPYLHQAYEKYRDKGFEILSVAFSDEVANIETFRREKYPMPWLHILVAEDNESAIRTKFEISGLPRPILISKQGTIVATDKELRGEGLAKVLSLVFSKVKE